MGWHTATDAGGNVRAVALRAAFCGTIQDDTAQSGLRASEGESSIGKRLDVSRPSSPGSTPIIAHSFPECSPLSDPGGEAGGDQGGTCEKAIGIQPGLFISHQGEHHADSHAGSPTD